MDHQAARAAGQRLGELRRQDRRGRAGQDGLRHRRGIEARKNPSLDLDVFGRVLLDVSGPAERLLERCRDAHAGADLTRRGAAEEIVLRKTGQDRIDVGERVGGRGRRRVPERYVMARPREADGPGTADESCTDDGDFAHAPALSQRFDIAADSDRLSGNVPSRAGNKKDHGRGDVLRGDHAA